MCQSLGEVSGLLAVHGACSAGQYTSRVHTECLATPSLHHCKLGKLRRTTGARHQHPAETGDDENAKDDEEASEQTDEDSWSSSEGEEDDDEESSHFESYNTSDDWTSSGEDEDEEEADQARKQLAAEAEHRRCVTSNSVLSVHAWAQSRERQCNAPAAWHHSLGGRTARRPG